MARSPRRAEAGMVTAEFAVAIPALIALFALLLTAVGYGIDAVRVIDAAGIAARAAARGESEASAVSAATRAAPAGSSISIGRSGGLVKATVRAPSLPGVAAIGLGGASASATAALEPGADP